MRNFSSISIYIFLFLIFNQASCQTENFAGNPVIKGWYADPEGIIFNNRYFIYPTYSAPYEDQVFMDAFSSKDLVTWEKHSRIIDTTAVKWAKYAMWAPSIIKKDDKYFLLFGANDIQSDSQQGGIGVAVANKPEGPFKDYLGKPLITTIINGAQPIDQFIFKDEENYYLIYGGWGHCNIALLNNDFTGFQKIGEEVFKEITPEGYVEGPFMFKRNNKYYFMWSEGGWGGPNYKVAYAIADSPTGPFKRIATILEQDPEIATGAGHHSLIKVPNKEEWYIVYHRRPLNETDANHRVTCIEKLTFDKEGKINKIKLTNKGVQANPLK
ncbi:glycoside hydrolase family 43 protein [Mesonia sp.]|uniref:glycoside hydrolase family 43 protein n=1 Tax=Mesonia sp. TaxID=1960830 RepID=UPI0017764B94|nr:glycoside hydrolase family 43 protein [Mesonia sp.]HIB38538.1 arabinan endo-1,5-alpha-L-arabinosidase [Mesonia sp.]